MSVDILMPKVGESVTSGVISTWLKKPGEAIAIDEPVVSVETDKATVDVPAPAAGTMGEQKYAAGAEVKVGEVLGTIVAGSAAVAAPVAQTPGTASLPVQAPRANEKVDVVPVAGLTPAVRRIVDEKGLDPAGIAGSGKDGRLLKSDVQDLPAVKAAVPPGIASALASAAAVVAPKPAAPAAAPIVIGAIQGAPDRTEKVVSMSPIRRTIAARLVEAQSTAAILTTFNEVDMTRIQELRAEHQDAFVKRHGIKLGFMSFFVKAAIEALKAYPSVNAEVRGTDIVYKNYYDLGVAVGGGKGLVVPIIRDADRLSFAQVEKTIADFGARAKDNKIKLEEMQGGTFSLTNGGIYGSMMSTPILNPPQSGILGMHNIVKRAVVVDDQIVIRPMMYLALSYDHRIVDGREAVSFLVRVKECIERPERLLLEA